MRDQFGPQDACQRSLGDVERHGHSQAGTGFSRGQGLFRQAAASTASGPCWDHWDRPAARPPSSAGITARRPWTRPGPAPLASPGGHIDPLEDRGWQRAEFERHTRRAAHDDREVGRGVGHQRQAAVRRPLGDADQRRNSIRPIHPATERCACHPPTRRRRTNFTNTLFAPAGISCGSIWNGPLAASLIGPP